MSVAQNVSNNHQLSAIRRPFLIYSKIELQLSERENCIEKELLIKISTYLFPILSKILKIFNSDETQDETNPLAESVIYVIRIIPSFYLKLRNLRKICVLKNANSLRKSNHMFNC